MKKLLLPVTLLLVIALPAADALAHTLSSRTGRRVAMRVCNAVTNDEDNPYICRRVGSGDRLGAHVIRFRMNMYDPIDGETCNALVRTRLRGSSVRYTASSGNCLADPFANL